MTKTLKKSRMKEQLRMCIACRSHIDKSKLVRIVKTPEDEILIDKTGKQNGRGAYVCSTQCLEKCKKQKLLNRAFRCNVPQTIYEKLSEEF